MARNLSTWILLRAMFSKFIGRSGPALRVYKEVFFCLLAKSATPKLKTHLFPFIFLLSSSPQQLKENEYREGKGKGERD